MVKHYQYNPSEMNLLRQGGICMRSTGTWMWRVTAVVSLLSLLLFLAGFGMALNPRLFAFPAFPDKTNGQAPQTEDKDRLHIVTLGDSLTRGAGDENGKGYVGYFRDLIEQDGQETILTNLAINGLESTGLLKQLKQQQVRQLISQADLILFTIGGNDLFRQTGGVYELDLAKVEPALLRLSHNLKAILDELRSLNENALIVYTTLYNPFADTDIGDVSTPPVHRWNSIAQETASRYKRVVVVPTFDQFYQKEQEYLFTDHFHPNKEGYQRMAERVYQAVK